MSPPCVKDRWWLQPVITVSVLTAFVIYSTWAAFQNKYYYVGANVAPRPRSAPSTRPASRASACPARKAGFALQLVDAVAGAAHPDLPAGLSTHLLLLPAQLLPRVLVVAARRAPSPTPTPSTRARPASRSSCRTCTATSSSPVWSSTSLLTYDAIRAFRQPGLGWGVTVGTLVLCVNAVLLWLYSLSCHACRHLCGGQVKSFQGPPDPLQVLEAPHAAQRQAHELRVGVAHLRRPHRRLRAPGRLGRPHRLQALLGRRNPVTDTPTNTTTTTY